MTQPFEKALVEIANVIANVNGIAQAPAVPQETMNIFPFAAIYLSDGVLAVGATGSRKSLYNVVIDVLTKAVDFPRDMEILNPFLDLIPEALLAEVSGNGERFNATISTFNEIRMSFIPNTTYAGVQMRGYRFIMNDVKILVNTS